MDTANPDILCFNETKIDEERLKELRVRDYLPPMYHTYWNCATVRKGYAGTAILTKVKPEKVEYDIGIEKHKGEGRVTTAEFKDFIVVSVYVPNSKDELKRLSYRVDEWDFDFHNYLDNLRKHGKPVIIAGDLNVAHHEIDVYDPKRMKGCACFTVEERDSF